MHEIGDCTLYHGDCLDILKSLPDNHVDCVVSSPPYWGLRNYNIEGQLGLENSPEEFLEKMTSVFDEVKRVLKDTGTCWVNMGDNYVKKQLMGMPWRLAFALQESGWYLRQDNIWHKPNPMPESAKDRCTKAHEYIFLLTKTSKYYFDQDSILEPCSQNTHARLSQDVMNQRGSDRAHGGAKTNGKMKAVARKSENNVPNGWANSKNYHDANPNDKPRHKNLDAREKPHIIHKARIKDNDSFDSALSIPPVKRNKRSVWTIPTKGFKEAHFATYPEKLVEPCILSGCPQGGVVLDPFMGSGTTGAVASKLGRKSIGIELNPEYLEIAKRRITEANRQPDLLYSPLETEGAYDNGLV